MLEHSYFCTVCSGYILIVLLSKLYLEKALENNNNKKKEKYTSLTSAWAKSRGPAVFPFPLRAAQPAQLPARTLPPPPPLSVTATPAPHVSSPPSFFTRRSRVGLRRQPKSRFSRDLACRDQTEPYKAPSDAPRLVFHPSRKKTKP